MMSDYTSDKNTIYIAPNNNNPLNQLLCWHNPLNYQINNTNQTRNNWINVLHEMFCYEQQQKNKQNFVLEQ